MDDAQAPWRLHTASGPAGKIPANEQGRKINTTIRNGLVKAVRPNNSSRNGATNSSQTASLVDTYSRMTAIVATMYQR